ncbi:MAG: hypothetical protein V3W20_14290 [Candidatus Neomarinimicrobiota bacterium]
MNIKKIKKFRIKNSKIQGRYLFIWFNITPKTYDNATLEKLLKIYKRHDMTRYFYWKATGEFY